MSFFSGPKPDPVLAHAAVAMESNGDCPHDDWMILSSNNVRPQMEGTCKLCGKSLPLYVLLNNWKDRVERELRAAAIRNGGGE